MGEAGKPASSIVLALLLIGVWIGAAAPAVAQQNPIRWSLEEAGRKDGAITIKVKATIDDGWHLYSITQPPGGPITTRISLPEDQSFALTGDITGPVPKTEHDENFNMDVEYYEGEAEFLLTVKPKGSGKQTLKVNAYFQSCNDKLCLPPKTVKLELQVDAGK